MTSTNRTWAKTRLGIAVFVVVALVGVMSSTVLAAEPLKPKTFSRVQIKDASGQDVWEFKGKDDGA